MKADRVVVSIIIIAYAWGRVDLKVHLIDFSFRVIKRLSYVLIPT